MSYSNANPYKVIIEDSRRILSQAIQDADEWEKANVGSMAGSVAGHISQILSNGPVLEQMPKREEPASGWRRYHSISHSLNETLPNGWKLNCRWYSYEHSGNPDTDHHYFSVEAYDASNKMRSRAKKDITGQLYSTIDGEGILRGLLETVQKRLEKKS